jgi:hypothetical protein
MARKGKFGFPFQKFRSDMVIQNKENNFEFDIMALHHIWNDAEIRFGIESVLFTAYFHELDAVYLFNSI